MAPSLPTSAPRRMRVRLPWSGLPVAARDAASGLVLSALSLLPLGVAGVELGGLHHEVHASVPLFSWQAAAAKSRAAQGRVISSSLCPAQ